MNPRTLILVVVALVFAGIAALLARNLVDDQQPSQVAQAPLGPKILVAAVNLPIGKIIEAQDLRWQSWPDDNVSEAYLRDEITNQADYVGYVVRDGVGVGEPLSTSKIVAPGERGFLAAVLAPGMRAMTIPVRKKDASGMGGLVFPGDRVDVILTHTVVDDSLVPRQVGETVFQNVRVLAIDTVAVPAAPKVSKTVTLEVTPKMAEELTIVQRLGTITLALRSLVDAEGSYMTNDEAMPYSGKSTYSWDAEVSDLAPPLDINQDKHPLQISRGDKTEVVVFKKDEQ